MKRCSHPPSLCIELLRQWVGHLGYAVWCSRCGAYSDNVKKTKRGARRIWQKPARARDHEVGAPEDKS